MGQKSPPAAAVKNLQTQFIFYCCNDAAELLLVDVQVLSLALLMDFQRDTSIT